MELGICLINRRKTAESLHRSELWYGYYSIWSFGKTTSSPLKPILPTIQNLIQVINQ